MPKRTPAEIVISAFGGVRKTAQAIGRNPGTVSRWQRPREQKGTDGEIPTRAQGAILEAAQRLHLDLCGADLVKAR